MNVQFQTVLHKTEKQDEMSGLWIVQNAWHITSLQQIFQSHNIMNKYAKFINRQTPPDLKLQDKKMPMTYVCTETNSLRFTHVNENKQLMLIEAARTVQPLPSNAAAVYFEVVVKNFNSRYEVGVGVIQKDCALKKHPGQSNLSIGYLSSGEVWINGKKIKFIHSFKPKSVVGVGIIYEKRQVFFTLDGKLLEVLDFFHDPATWPKFYPCISQRSEGDLMEMKFKDFLFDFQNFASKIEKQCLEKIDQEALQSLNVYALVGDYLKFHGYSKTFASLKSVHQFQELSSFVEHPFWQSKLKFDKEEGELETENVDKNKNEGDGNEEEELIFERKFSARQRIMSDYWGDINELSKKKHSDSQKLVIESRRKSSVISVASANETNNKLVEGQAKRQSESEKGVQRANQKLTNYEKFLVEERISLLQLIRMERLEEALELAKEKIPQLFCIVSYMQAYFHMQIYLRTLKNEGPNKAMVYMRECKNIFQQHKDQLYPVYSTQANSIKFVTFSYMMSLISLKPGSENDATTSNQFYAFSNYVNQIILKNMGLFPDSRLDILVNHLKFINSKNEQYQINGLSFINDI